ncbi:unnamed protein product [Timema podura]|uniref:Proton-associated sugar transporter A n=1 Tax=Timema podura TaxID=61482 RepID=A0ABN7NFL8_TIMPD|nr:unnamed protein product [Timema podura]
MSRMVDKLRDYEGVLGRLHTWRSSAKERWLQWKDSRTHSASYNPRREDLEEDFSHIYRRKTRMELVRVSAAVMGLEFSYAAETAFVSPTLLKIGVPHKSMSFVWCLSPLVGFFLTPVLGSLSDRCRLKVGRRRPFIMGLALGVLIGMLLVPYGEDIGHALGDFYPSRDLPSNDTEPKVNNTETPTAGPDSQYPHPWSIFFTVLGTVLLDFDADACQSPARAYLLDVTIPEDHGRGLSTFTIVAGLGGFMGYSLGGINWDATALGELLGGHVKAVFTLITFIFIACVIYTVTSFREIPLGILEKQKQKGSSQKMSPRQLGEGTRMVEHGDGQSYGAATQEGQPNNPGVTDKVTAPNKSEYRLIEGKNGVDNGYVNFGFDEGYPKHPITETSFINSPPGKDIPSSPILALGPSPSEPSLGQYLLSIVYMPSSLRILCLSNLFCWMAHVCYSLYFTDYVGEEVFRGNPQVHRPGRHSYVALKIGGPQLNCLFSGKQLVRPQLTCSQGNSGVTLVFDWTADDGEIGVRTPFGSTEDIFSPKIVSHSPSTQIQAASGTPSRELYEEGVRFGCWGMAMYSLSCSCYSLIIERLISKFSLGQLPSAGGIGSSFPPPDGTRYQPLSVWRVRERGRLSPFTPTQTPCPLGKPPGRCLEAPREGTGSPDEEHSTDRGELYRTSGKPHLTTLSSTFLSIDRLIVSTPPWRGVVLLCGHDADGCQSFLRAKKVYVGGVLFYSVDMMLTAVNLSTGPRRAKKVYVGGVLFYSVGMMLMAVTRHRVGVIVFSWAAGVMYSTLFTLPYLLIAHYHAIHHVAGIAERHCTAGCQLGWTYYTSPALAHIAPTLTSFSAVEFESSSTVEAIFEVSSTVEAIVSSKLFQFEVSSTGEAIHATQLRGLGTDVAIVSSMVFLAQFILSMFMGYIISAVETTTAVVAVASFLSFCGAVTATKVMYLDL